MFSICNDDHDGKLTTRSHSIGLIIDNEGVQPAYICYAIGSQESIRVKG